MTNTTSVHPQHLVAHTRRVDDDVDILATLTTRDFAWWHLGQGLVTNGVARRVPATYVQDVLSTIDPAGEDDMSGPGPIAVGALPFDGAAAARAELIIPARSWRRDAEGRTWVTDVSDSSSPARLRSLAPDPAPIPLHGQGDTSKAEWAHAVETAIAHIEVGELAKVVLSRQVTVESDTEFRIGDVMRRLRTGQPGCYVFAAGGFVGASPELLVARRATEVRSRPMAGTVDRRAERAMTWLEESTKNRHEHALVVEAVVAGLQPRCREPVQVSPSYAEPFADLAHIVTDVVGTLTQDAPSALDLALALHPTPAVAGTPTNRALALIDAVETRPRGRYGGPVGWVDAQGDGEFAVALRCAEVQGSRAVLYAGAGIVAGSTWQDEWHETEAKLEAMRRALARG
jgi:menaquinone-specific isochorismate synthase